MKVLVVGSGGREHALGWKLAQSTLVDELFFAPGNAGTELIGENLPINAEDVEGIIKFAKNVDLVVVGPENPLAMGIINELPPGKGFGPTREATTIESDKAFAKEVMKKVNVPTARFKIFTDYGLAKSYLETISYPQVIKASGLAAGKGSFVVKTKEQALEVLHDLMVNRTLGDAGSKVVIEEYLEGEEVSLLVFVDGKDLVPLIPSQDHKQLYDGDKGPNTGGMGAYAPVPFLDKDEIENILEHIFNPTIWQLKREGVIYKGVLYAGLMLTDEGPKVLEFNARFGDPETQAILPLLGSDLMEPILATIDGELANVRLKWQPDTAVCVVLASKGYPGKYEKGKEIVGLDDVENVIVFHAGTKREDNRIVTAGGRVLNVVAVDKDLPATVDKVYEELPKIQFDGVYYRSDIGWHGLRYLGKW